MTNPKEEAARIGEEWKRALEQLSDEDKRLLSLLRLMGDVLDPRYELKSVRLLVARALSDPEFRSRLAADPEAILSKLRGHSDLPENLRVRFVENTDYELTVVLPPPSSALSKKSQTIRDFIVSRTSAVPVPVPTGSDDNDVMPITADLGDSRDHLHFGDPSHDGH